MSTDSYFLEDRSQPLVNQNPGSLNDRLQTDYLDVADDDTSFQANLVRRVARFVGQYLFTPKQVLAILRVLKAMTLCFLVLCLCANVMYLLFVHVLATEEVATRAGGNRDTVLRLYGLGFSLLALAMEIDYTPVVQRFAGCKAFIPRALLYLFLAVLTASRPAEPQVDYSQYNNYNQYNNNGDDDNANGDDAYAQQQGYSTANYDDEIPSSAVGFQMVVSHVLGACAIGYLVCGLLCFDRFTALAFVSTKDPTVTTAIPPTQAKNNTTTNTTFSEDDDDESRPDAQW